MTGDAPALVEVEFFLVSEDTRRVLTVTAEVDAIWSTETRAARTFIVSDDRIEQIMSAGEAETILGYPLTGYSTEED